MPEILTVFHPPWKSEGHQWKKKDKKDLFPCLISLFNNIHLLCIKVLFFDTHEKYTFKDNYPLPNINDFTSA